MKANWKRFREIIENPDMELAEKYGRLVAHIDKIEAELQEKINYWSNLSKDTCRYAINQELKEILGIE